ncbi:glycosyltransferase family 2 protein [Flavobacterium piscinae]|uniref:glycosyltransferase family 2 protein n=1 Tax=Flavobacterium piscinae TaxID=2506424 RepID=UPI002AABCFE3|nr:glycosyltransferase family 2 protein [Flavobacterium piscinae]
MNISVVIPLLNEEESLSELHSWIVQVMNKHNYNYEIIFIDDGSSDNSWNVIESLTKQNSNVKAIRFLKNFGKSQALHAGFAKAKGDVVVTMDADLQDNPEEIPELYDLILNQNYDLVSGWKKKDMTPLFPKTYLPNYSIGQRRKTSGVQLNDFNCGLKAYKNLVIKNIEVSGEMHRYIPVLAKNAGFSKIGEKVVKHQARKYGETKFGMERFINGFLDLITIWFLSRFGKRPMHLFGAWGVVMFLIGFSTSGYIGISKLYRLYNDLPYDLVTNSPYFYISLTTMIIGSQLFLAGFLGEIILRNKESNENYKISNELNMN